MIRRMSWEAGLIMKSGKRMKAAEKKVKGRGP
jgi:hypothetical protein